MLVVGAKFYPTNHVMTLSLNPTQALAPHISTSIYARYKRTHWHKNWLLQQNFLLFLHTRLNSEG